MIIGFQIIVNEKISFKIILKGRDKLIKEKYFY